MGFNASVRVQSQVHVSNKGHEASQSSTDNYSLTTDKKYGWKNCVCVKNPKNAALWQQENTLEKAKPL